MNNETIILGAGLTGLAVSKLTGLPVVAEEVAKPIGPTYLYANPINEKFLRHIGVDPLPVINTINIGALSLRLDSEETKLTRRSWLNYSRKTQRFKPVPEPFDYYNIDWDSIFSILTHDVTITIASISKIDVVRREMIGTDYEGRDIKISYGKLISTIPAPVFARLAGLDWKLKYISTSIKRVQKRITNDYSYVTRPRSNVLRYTKISSEECWEEKICPKGQGNSYKIISGKIPPIQNVQFVGRLATWDASMLFHDAIKTFLPDNGLAQHKNI